jgi:pyridoxal 5-phosphate dependent beta-lyase
VSPLLHLDAAAGSRASEATVAAVTDHLRLERELGIYPAEAAAAAVLDRLHADLGAVLGVPAEGVALVEGATAALDTLLQAWPLPARARVGVLPSEWGPNLDTLRHHGLDPVPLPVDSRGLVDLDALSARLGSLEMVHLVQVPAHRGLRQPVAEAAEACREAGVPLWVDAAQAVGQTRVDCGADAVYGTGRKWLAGPRGVGFLGVDPGAWPLLRPPRTERFAGLPVVRMLESGDAHAAGRVGLAAAVEAYAEAGPERVHEQLDAVGELTREVLGDLEDWEVLPGTGPITALRPTAGQDPFGVKDALLSDHDILVTASHTWRAPELTEPLLRVSPQRAITEDDLLRMKQALTRI